MPREAKELYDTSEFVLLAVATFGAVVVVMVAQLVYRNWAKISKKIDKAYTALKCRKEITAIEQSLKNRPKEELVKVALSIMAWPRHGLPDEDLHICRPDHYGSELKEGESDGQPGRDFLDQAEGVLSLKSEDELHVIIRNALNYRSLRTLRYLRRCLE
jgi:hypothetical protein